jgi:hypothetical protein
MRTTLAKELVTMAHADQNYRKQWFTKRDDPAYLEGRKRLDDAHVVRLKEIIKSFGWPSKKLVGTEASHAAWLLAQHADIETQKHCLKLIETMSESENDPRQAAYLTDKIRVRTGQPQLYGTQYVKNGDDLVLYTVDSPEQLDERRKKLGLPPASYKYDFEAAKRADEEGIAFSSLGGWR